MKIFKEKLVNQHKQILELRAEKMLCVKPQMENPTLWYIHDETIPKSKYEILIYNTGEKLDNQIITDYIYLDTVLIWSDSLVYHIFYKKID